MNGEEFEIKTKSIDITEKWQIDLNQPNVKKDNEINDETKGHLAPEDINCAKFPENMSHTALAVATPTAKKAPKPKTEPTHPPSTVMIKAAVKALKDPKGSSLSAIKKYINSNYKVNIVKLAPFIKKGIKSLVEKKVLIQVKGKGASGSFMVAKVTVGQKI